MTTFSGEAWLTITNALVATAICSFMVFIAVLALCSLVHTTSTVRCSLLRVATVVTVIPLLFFLYPVTNSASLVTRADHVLPATNTKPHANDEETVKTAAPESSQPTGSKHSQSKPEPTNSQSGEAITEPPTTVLVKHADVQHTISTVAKTAVPTIQPSLDKPISVSWQMSPTTGRAIALTWIFVSTFLCLRHLYGVIAGTWYWQRQLKNTERSSVSESLVSQSVHMTFSERVAVPVVVGILRPIIVVPAELKSSSPASLQMVMQHELNHIRRHDILWNNLINFIVAIVWFQPLAWIVRRRHRTEQENACDDAVLRNGHPPHEYALLLTELAQAARKRIYSGYSFVSMAGRRPIEQRIHLILDSARRRATSSKERFLWTGSYGAAAILLSIFTYSAAPDVQAAAGFDDASKETNSQNASATRKRNAESEESTEKAEVVREVPDGFKVFHGRVVDESDAGVEGANVYLEGRNQKVPSAISGRDGSFEMLIPLEPDVRRELVFLRTEHSPTKRIGIYPFQMADDEIPLRPPRPRNMPLNPVTVHLAKTYLQPVKVADKQGAPIRSAFVGLLSDGAVISATRTDQDGLALLPVISDLSRGIGKVFALTESHGLEFQTYAPDSNTTVELVLDVSKPFTIQFLCPKLPKPEDEIRSDLAESEESFPTEPLVNVPILPWGLRGGDAHGFYCEPFLCSQLCEPLCPRTDEAGNLTISWMPKWASTAMMDYCVADQHFWSQRSFNKTMESNEVMIDRLVEMKGKVIGADHKPATGVRVTLQGHSLLPDHFLPFQRVRMTDDSGQFSFLAPTRHRHMVHAEMPGQFSTAFETDLLAGAQHDFYSLFVATRIELSFSGTNQIRGCVTSGKDRTPLRNRTLMTITRRADPNNKSLFDEPRIYSQPNIENRIATKVQTDENGCFSLLAADGSWVIEDPFTGLPLQFSASNGFTIERDFHSDTKTLLQVNTIDKASGQHVSASVDIWGNRPSLSDSPQLVPLSPHAIQAWTAKGTGFIFWDGKSHEIKLPLAPRVTLQGRLVDGSGKPASNRSVRYTIHPSVPEGSEVPADFSSFISGSISCNEDGSFKLKDVIQNCKCEILLTPDEGKEWAKQQWDVAATVCPDASDAIDLGDLKVPEIR
jgi:beta-lactamase regulating signal transducer with metallopeptidase domain